MGELDQESSDNDQHDSHAIAKKKNCPKQKTYQYLLKYKNKESLDHGSGNSLFELFE